MPRRSIGTGKSNGIDKPKPIKWITEINQDGDNMSYVRPEGDDSLEHLVSFGPGIPLWIQKDLAKQVAFRLNQWHTQIRPNQPELDLHSDTKPTST